MGIAIDPSRGVFAYVHCTQRQKTIPTLRNGNFLGSLLCAMRPLQVYVSLHNENRDLNV